MNANAISDGPIQMAWGIEVGGQTETKSIKIILIILKQAYVDMHLYWLNPSKIYFMNT